MVPQTEHSAPGWRDERVRSSQDAFLFLQSRGLEGAHPEWGVADALPAGQRGRPRLGL